MMRDEDTYQFERSYLGEDVSNRVPVDAALKIDINDFTL
jgi:hypothetical protein